MTELVQSLNSDKKLYKPWFARAVLLSWNPGYAVRAFEIHIGMCDGETVGYGG